MECLAENAAMKLAIAEFCKELSWACDEWKKQAHIAPLFKLANDQTQPVANDLAHPTDSKPQQAPADAYVTPRARPDSEGWWWCWCNGDWKPYQVYRNAFRWDEMIVRKGDCTVTARYINTRIDEWDAFRGSLWVKARLPGPRLCP